MSQSLAIARLGKSRSSKPRQQRCAAPVIRYLQQPPVRRFPVSSLRT